MPEIPTVFPIPTATQEKDQKSRDWLALFVLILVAVLFFVLSQVDPDLRRSSLWGTIGSSAALAATIYWLFQKRADQRFTEKAEQMIARSAEMTEELLMDSDVLDSALERITKDKSFGCGLAAIAKGYRNARVCRDLRWDLVVANEDATYFRIRGRVTYKRLLKPRTLTIMCTRAIFIAMSTTSKTSATSLFGYSKEEQLVSRISRSAFFSSGRVAIIQTVGYFRNYQSASSGISLIA